MGGFWKLTAMSAVIGAGLVIVWQAQLGLLSAPQPQANVSTDDGESAEPFEPMPEALAPAELVPPRPSLAAARTDSPTAVAASIPPEATDDAQPGPLLLPDLPPPASARYQRGVDFNRRTEPVAEPNPVAEPAADDDPFASAAPPADTPEPLPSGPLKPVAETAIEPIGNDDPFTTTGSDRPQPVRAKVVATTSDDPFSDAAPSEPIPETTPRSKRMQSGGAAPRIIIPEEEEPLLGLPEPTAVPASNQPAPLPLEADDPFGPADRPVPVAANDDESLEVVLGAPAPFPSRRKPPPLPLDLDDPANAVIQPSNASFPDESDVPRARTGSEQPAPLFLDHRNSQPALPAPSNLNDRTPERAGPRAPEPSPLVGDGLVTPDAPRGVQEPRLTIEKIAPSKAALGQELVYAVLVKNVGGSPASHVVVEDRIPKGARLLGTHPRAELLDKRLIWRLGTLPPGGERKISIKVVPEEEGPLGSVAKVSFASEVAAEIVITAPQLRLRLSAPTSVTMGETVKLLFTISNTGEGAASNVVLRSILPDGLKHPSGNDLEYTVGDLPPKQSREVPLEVLAAKPGRITHQASVTADGNAHAETEAVIDIQGEQLVLTRRGQSRVYVGKTSVFTNQVLNEGERPVQKVKVSEVVPAGFEFVEASDGGRFDAETRTISWTVGPLAPGEDHAVWAKLVPKAPGQFEGAVSAAGPTGSVAQVKASVAVEGFPSLAIEPLGDERVVASGERLTTRVQLRNSGTAAARRVVLTVQVPDELKLVSAKGPATFQVFGQRVVFDPVESLAPRDRATYELVLEALTPGDARLELHFAAEHLRRPVRHEEALQVVGEAQ